MSPDPQTGPGARPVAVFVLGFGRSGTSALARVLSLCGGTLPPGLLGASKANPRGFWEPRAVIYLDEVILRRHGSSGYDPTLRAEDEDAFDVERNAQYVAKAKAYLESLPSVPLLVVKEPKMTLLSDIWFEAARLAGFDVAVIVAVRHLGEVVGSLDRRANDQNYVQNSPEITSAWWLKFTLLAERRTRGMTRVFVEYANLMEDWRREMDRISAALGVDLGARDEGAIDGFLTPELRHHRHTGQVVEPFGGDWMSAVYDALAAAARDEPWDPSGLDRVYEEYRASERGFRMAFEDYQRYRNLNKLMPPFLVKVGLGFMALIHRRRGTWA